MKSGGQKRKAESWVSGVQGCHKECESARKKKCGRKTSVQRIRLNGGRSWSWEVNTSNWRWLTFSYSSKTRYVRWLLEKAEEKGREVVVV